MKKRLFILALFAAVLSSAHAQPEIKAYGSMPRKGTVIHGVVRDSEGPVKAVDIFEINENHEVVAYTFSDKNGHFSFKLVNQADSLYVGGFKFNTAKSPISKNQYEITLERIPEDVVLNPEMNSLFRRTFRSIIEESENFPLLYMDGHIIYRDSTVWEGIDPDKGSHSKQEMSRLFGVEAGQIESVKVYEKDAQTTIDWCGPDGGKRGAIEIQTKGKEQDK